EKIVITCCHGVLVSVYVLLFVFFFFFFFFSSRRRHTRSDRDWSSDVCSSDLRHDDAVRANRERERDDDDDGVCRTLAQQAGAVTQVLEQQVHGFSSPAGARSEERRVGKECRSRWSSYH